MEGLESLTVVIQGWVAVSLCKVTGANLLVEKHSPKSEGLPELAHGYPGMQGAWAIWFSDSTVTQALLRVVKELIIERLSVLLHLNHRS